METTPKTKLTVPWQVWPTHWAGGSSSVKAGPHNTIWIDSDCGEICRFPTEQGHVTQAMYDVANKLVKDHNDSLKNA